MHCDEEVWLLLPKNYNYDYYKSFTKCIFCQFKRCDNILMNTVILNPIILTESVTSVGMRLMGQEIELLQLVELNC